jgi:hypothetical protein
MPSFWEWLGERLFDQSAVQVTSPSRRLKSELPELYHGAVGWFIPAPNGGILTDAGTRLTISVF